MRESMKVSMLAPFKLWDLLVYRTEFFGPGN